ncbi:unnamed protein product [Owenia fusiformis]|uniref:Uncharacterized protein n=1 Tax=Owenia fusiformis TaxID=6347 RepID=A0A8J1T4W7_OWEFU|nr:unnamed protein product [Owenia fusiformis]
MQNPTEVTDLDGVTSHISKCVHEYLSKVVCMPTHNLKVLKRTTDLKKGDFSVALQKVNDQVGISDDISPALMTQSQSLGLPIRSYRYDAKGGFLYITLERAVIFKSLLAKVSEYGTEFGCKKDINNSIEMVVHIPVEWQSDGQMNLDQVRAILLSQHASLLLQNAGHKVHDVQYNCPEPVNKLIKLYLNKDNKSDENKSTVSLEEDMKALFEKCLNSKCAEKCKDGGTGTVINLKSYSEEISDLNGGFDKNIQYAKFDSWNDTKLKQVAELSASYKTFQNDLHCIHIVAQKQAYSQQQVDLIWSMLEDNTSHHIEQSHFVYRGVASRCNRNSGGGHNTMPNAQQFYNLRFNQMKESTIMKYGNIAKGEKWESMMHELTSAAIKFEMLTTVPSNMVKLDLSEQTDKGGPMDNKGGSFVLYNCARLSTLFQHFHSNVAAGVYPPLPDLDSIDWSLLKDEEEWSLLFNYVMSYPSIVQQAIAPLHKGIHSQIQTHKICNFLLHMARDMSSYYSRVHILSEARPHLLPLMHSRLHLMKGLQQVMHNALSLLNIQPPTQM